MRSVDLSNMSIEKPRCRKNRLRLIKEELKAWEYISE